MIPLLYEDNEVIAVCKSAGLSSIPERDLSVPSLRVMLEAQQGSRLFTVHRLDKEVSGVIVFAKNAAAHTFLNSAFSGHKVKKTYLALVHGLVAPECGVIDAPIRQFGSGRMGVDERAGKPSRTRYKVLQRQERSTLVEVYPETGRRHQIRVHFYHIKHPIVGDLRYGETALQKRFKRLMLHAMKIEWENREGRNVVVEARIPEEFVGITL
jgi:tRNA pseudouridine32 synthase / 23S rRNA pseudouridine746 synthase